MKEINFRRWFTKYLEEDGLWVYALENKINFGMPDLLVLRERRSWRLAIFIELKVDGGKLSKIQELWWKEYTGKKGRGFLIDYTEKKGQLTITPMMGAGSPITLGLENGQLPFSLASLLFS